MPERRDPAVFSIASHRPFADALAEGLIAQFGTVLSLGVVLVPNNRAATAIQDAFVRKSEHGLLLPRLVPIGDPDLGEHVGAALDPLDQEPIPPVVDPLQRQMILAKMLQENLPVEKMGAIDGAQAMRLAADLGRVLDQLTVERKSPSDLIDLDLGNLSEHWNNSLTLLKIVLEEWPLRLAKLGRIDMSDRRNRQLDRMAERWRIDPPSGFVVAAGISTGAPAIASLVRQVSRLAQGQVVLAGLDLKMPDEEWAALAGDEKQYPVETHPQFHLWQLLDRMDVARAEVKEWQWGHDDAPRARRGARVSMALAPAAFTHKWVDLTAKDRRFANVYALELPTPAEEAQAIALALREAIMIPGQTAALVTPDRQLATRVSALLQRWDIQADDSAGRPLSATLPGTLLLALAGAAAEHFHAVPLLNLLKHPLVANGDERLAWLDGVRSLDLALRGPQAAPGLNGIDQFLAAGDHRTAPQRERATAWWNDVKPSLMPLEDGFRANAGLPAMLAGICQAAGALSGEKVWAGQEGRALSALIDSLVQWELDAPWATADALPHLLRNLMDDVAVRPAQGGHPRLSIWGLLEAKLQSADVMILGGLNEGVWPQLSGTDPWLAPAIRRQLGLPSMERRIGLSAHDLVGAMAADQVLLTRAKRDSRSPTVASRFWLRLKTFTGGFELPALRYDLLALALDKGVGQRVGRPRPVPLPEHRPRSISVTEVDGLKADPYAFYARKILKLLPLQAPGEEPDAAWRGTFLHEVLGDWGNVDKFQSGLLLPRLRAAFASSGLHPVVRAMWEPRFEQAATQFEAFVDEQRAEGRHPIAAETQGSVELDGIKLTGQADRIDRLKTGELAIVDYKTGAAPSDKKVQEGYALQLGLIGHIAQSGGFKGIEAPATYFEYWSQSRDSDKSYGRITSPTHGTSRSKNKSDPDKFVEEMLGHFRSAAANWLLGDAPFTAKLHPDYAFADYDHLMRLEEWQGRDG